jgi:pimeloyl-ACP methyl ester carboxylesterase
MRQLAKAALLAGALGLAVGPYAQATSNQARLAKPTIVLVHGAFAESAGWNGVAQILADDGFAVVAAANPLRSVAGDGSYVRSLVSSVAGPVILVGHSYGGTVISTAAAGTTNVRGLVYVSAFAPDVGETSFELAGKFPGGTLASALPPPVDLPGGGKDLYIHQDRFAAQFAADVPPAKARLMSIGQRPLNEAALTEPAAVAAWRSLPSWWIYGSADLNIPPEAMSFMAERAGSRKTVVIPGASHVVMVSHPREVARLIEDAAALSADTSDTPRPEPKPTDR